jgi:hypothetical protein
VQSLIAGHNLLSRWVNAELIIKLKHTHKNHLMAQVWFANNQQCKKVAIYALKILNEQKSNSHWLLNGGYIKDDITML